MSKISSLAKFSILIVAKVFSFGYDFLLIKKTSEISKYWFLNYWATAWNKQRLTMGMIISSFSIQRPFHLSNHFISDSAILTISTLILPFFTPDAHENFISILFGKFVWYMHSSWSESVDSLLPSFLCQITSNDCVLKLYKLAPIVKGDPKAPFSIATTPRCWGERY